MALKPVRLVFLCLCLAIAAVAFQSFQELFRSGLVALQRNDLAAAEQNLERAATLEPGNARVWVALAQTYRKRAETVKADEAAQKAGALGANDSAVMGTLAVYYFEAAQPLLQGEKFGDVLSLLDGAPAAVAKTAQIELVKGVAFYGLRRFDEASAEFFGVIALDASLKQPYLFLGRMLDHIPARLEEATRLFAVYERNDPSDFEGYLLHAKALNARAVEPENARKLLEKAIAMQPGSADAHFELGELLERLRRYPEAAAEFERAAALNPNEPATHYKLSRLYQRLNKPEAAIAEREQHRKMVAVQNAAR